MLYVCMWGMVRMPFKRARVELFILTPVYSETTRSVRKFRRKRLFFRTQKVAETGYYGIEDPFPDIISKLLHFRWGYEVPIVGCQEPLVVRMP